MIYWPGRSHDKWMKLRDTLLMETAEYLSYHLSHPELTVHIPTIPVGRGSFSRKMANHFWEQVLFADA